MGPIAGKYVRPTVGPNIGGNTGRVRSLRPLINPIESRMSAYIAVSAFLSMGSPSQNGAPSIIVEQTIPSKGSLPNPYAQRVLSRLGCAMKCAQAKTRHVFMV